VALDTRRDLPLLAIPGGPPPVDVADQYRFVCGQDVLAIGNPGVGGAQAAINAVSRGVMSTELDVGGRPYFQLNMAINPGNSGGPVFDLRGRVVGVVVAKFTRQESMALVIPPGDLRDALAKARHQSADEADRVRSFHRAYVAFNGLAGAARVYEAGLRGAGRAMADAIQNNADPNAALRTFSAQFDPQIAQKNEALTEDLLGNLSAVVVDRHLEAAARTGLQELWTMYRA
jgi:serine protease Do